MKNASTKTLISLGFLIAGAAFSFFSRETSGVATVLIFFGSLFLVIVPLIVSEIVTEFCRSVWQSWRVAGWVIHTEKAEGNGHHIETVSKMWTQMRYAFGVFKREIFSSYTTLSVKGKTFYFHPSKEAAYFKAQEEAEDDCFDPIKA